MARDNRIETGFAQGFVPAFERGLTDFIDDQRRRKLIEFQNEEQLRLDTERRERESQLTAISAGAALGQPGIEQLGRENLPRFQPQEAITKALQAPGTGPEGEPVPSAVTPEQVTQTLERASGQQAIQELSKSPLGQQTLSRRIAGQQVQQTEREDQEFVFADTGKRLTGQQRTEIRGGQLGGKEVIQTREVRPLIEAQESLRTQSIQREARANFTKATGLRGTIAESFTSLYAPNGKLARAVIKGATNEEGFLAGFNDATTVDVTNPAFVNKSIRAARSGFEFLVKMEDVDGKRLITDGELSSLGPDGMLTVGMIIQQMWEADKTRFSRKDIPEITAQAVTQFLGVEDRFIAAQEERDRLNTPQDVFDEAAEFLTKFSSLADPEATVGREPSREALTGPAVTTRGTAPTVEEALATVADLLGRPLTELEASEIKNRPARR